MTVRAVGQMCRCINKSIRMTAYAVIGAGGCYQAAVIRRRHMDRVPGGTMTRCTVAAGTKVLAYRRAGKATVTCMTGSTGVMRCCISAGQRWWITMTGGAIRRSYLDQ